MYHALSNTISHLDLTFSATQTLKPRGEMTAVIIFSYKTLIILYAS